MSLNINSCNTDLIVYRDDKASESKAAKQLEGEHVKLSVTNSGVAVITLIEPLKLETAATFHKLFWQYFKITYVEIYVGIW